MMLCLHFCTCTCRLSQHDIGFNHNYVRMHVRTVAQPTICSTIFLQTPSMFSHPVLVPRVVCTGILGYKTPHSVANYCALWLYFRVLRANYHVCRC